MSKLPLILLLPLLSFSYPKHVKDTLREISTDIYGVFGTYEQVSKRNKGFISNAYLTIRSSENTLKVIFSLQDTKAVP